MPKVDRAKWTAAEREFDRIMTKLESRNQLQRIDGRSEFRKFEARFTEEQMEDMAVRIGCKVTKKDSNA